MIAYKFLRSGRVSPFSGFVWPSDGSWVEASSSPRLCVAGIHACQAEHLAYWTSNELWVIELGGAVSAERQKVVAGRARLVRRLGAWNREQLAAFAKACAERAKDNVIAALRRDARARALEAAERIYASPIGLALAEMAERVASEVDAVSLMGGYLADAIRYGMVDPAAGAFCAAHTGLTEDGFHAERAWQSRWIARAVGIEASQAEGESR